MLSLAEQLLLLALDDERGTVASSAQQPLKYGLAAAGIVDLLLADRLAMGEKNRITVAEAGPSGDEILEEMLEKIRQSKKVRNVKDWVGRFGNGEIKRLQERLEGRLVDRGILRVEEGRYLMLIPWRHYPTVDGMPETGLVEELREVLLGGRDPDAETAILISLARACKVLDRLFPKEQRKQVDQRAKEIAKGEFAGEAVSKAAAEAAAAMVAVMTAISAASIASSSSSSS